MPHQSFLSTDAGKLEVLRMRHEGMSINQIAETVGMGASPIARFLRKEKYKSWWEQNPNPIAGGTYKDHHEDLQSFNGVTRFIITSAQNNTYVHRPFLKALEHMAERLKAKIIVGSFSYNKSSFQRTQKDQGDWYDPLIAKYIISEPMKIAEGLVYCGELNITPTAPNPLSGMDSYAKNNSAIIPHAKMRVEPMPGAKGTEVRHLYTTGAVTQRNYVAMKAGQKASFHHVFGAQLVEVDTDGKWFVRQLIAETTTGNFYDLDTYYTKDGFTTGHRIEAVNYGDVHAEHIDMQAAFAAFANPKSILHTLNPKYQFVHDVGDNSARNHHTINDPHHRFKQFTHKAESVENDIKDVCEVLSLMALNKQSQVIVVESNHDLVIERWLKTADYKQDPVNALLFLELQYIMYKNISEGTKNFSIFEYAVKSRDPSLENIRFLRTDESFVICGEDGIECGQHGHNGANGSKGTAKAFTKFGMRYNVGHSHSARIVDGVYQAGTLSKLDMGYNKGGTTWSHSHIVTYPNGKRTLITSRGSRWRAEN